MGKVDERKRKKKRMAEELAAQVAAKTPKPYDPTPEEKAAHFAAMDPYNQACHLITQARLEQKFGVKNTYDDWEFEEADEELEAEGAYPPDPDEVFRIMDNMKPDFA